MVKVALLIGISEYEPGLNPLPAAVKDIEALQRVLKDPEMGGFDEIKTLPNPDRQTMESEIETLFSSRAKDDLVLLFFSGHGIKDDSGKLYFATRITRKNLKGELIRSTAVATNFVHEVMNNSRAKRQTIILDCCFSGAFDPALQAKDDGSVDLQTQLGAEGRVVLTSSSSTQYSFEQQGSDLSIYTRYLVEGIETGAGDRNEDGFVSVLELHEYAASKVRETAPKMTPKIIVLKDKGFEIVLSKARVTDPKLRYRKAASRYANAGTIRPAGRAVLNTLRQQLGLAPEEAAEIETEVLRPYQERLANLQNYREALIAEAEHEYPLSEEAHKEMNMLQELLGLRDADILPIKQQVEAQFAQKSELYQQNLAQYKQVFIETIQREFPLNQQAHQSLENLQRSLGLRDEDIKSIEQPLLQQAKIRYQEKLRQQQEAEQQRQAELEQKRQKAEYENKLRRYEQDFANAIQGEYPLGQARLNELKNFQQQLGLKDEDVALIEQIVREPLEIKYQENLRQQEQAEQRRQKKLEQEHQRSEYENNVQPQSHSEAEVNFDLTDSVFLTADEMITGVEKQITIENETITVKIPAGVTIGKILRIRGKGKLNPLTRERGNLYLKVDYHGNFDSFLNELFGKAGTSSAQKTEIDSNSFDLEANLQLTSVEMSQGVQKRVTFSGEVLDIRIPPRTYPGVRVRVKGKGRLNSATQQRGDLYLVIHSTEEQNVAQNHITVSQGMTKESLGVETLGGVMTVIIPSNTLLPAKVSEIFSTAVDGQNNVEIHVLKGNSELAKDNVSLGTFRIDEILFAPRGVPQIEVTFSIDVSGVLSVSAKDKGTGKEASVTLTPNA